MTIGKGKSLSWLAKGALGLGACLLVAVGLVPTMAQAEEPIKIGLSITQTGPYSPPAKFELKGYKLAVAELNKSGGLLGRPVKLVYYDDQGHPSKAIQLYQRLMTRDDVDLLVSPYETDLTAAIAPLVSRNQRVMTCLAANSSIFQGRYPYLVQAITQTTRYMTPLVDLAHKRGYSRIALLIQNTQFPIELAQGIVEEAKKQGLKVVFKEKYSPNTDDFSALVLKAKRSHPDVIVGATYLADSVGIVRAAKAQGINAKMFGFSIGPVEPEFGSSLGDAANGILGSTLYFPTLQTTGNQQFVSAFKKMFGGEPDYHAAVAYASLKLLADATSEVGSLDQGAIRKKLLNTSKDTVVGHFKVNDDGLQVGYRSYLIQWQNGKQELVWPKGEQTTPLILPHPAWK